VPRKHRVCKLRKAESVHLEKSSTYVENLLLSCIKNMYPFVQNPHNPCALFVKILTNEIIIIILTIYMCSTLLVLQPLSSITRSLTRTLFSLPNISSFSPFDSKAETYNEQKLFPYVLASIAPFALQLLTRNSIKLRSKRTICYRVGHSLISSVHSLLYQFTNRFVCVPKSYAGKNCG